MVNIFPAVADLGYAVARWRPTKPIEYLLIVVVAVVLGLIDRLTGYRLFRRRRYYDDDSW